MPRVNFVKKARKAIPESGIKVGESYYWWSFRYGGKRVSKTHPRPSQLTQSEYLSTAYSLQEQLEDFEIDPEDMASLSNELTSIADDLRTLGSEQEDKRSNMPDQLQDGEIGERLQNRAEACEEVASELESAASEVEDLFEETRSTVVAEANEQIAKLKVAVAPRRGWGKYLLKLEVEEEDIVSEDENSFGGIADQIGQIPVDMDDKSEPAKAVRDTIEWLRNAWEYLCESVKETAQDRVNDISWEIDP